jgi:flagellar M-ring protein FliF
MDQLFSQMWKGFQSLPASRKLTILAAAAATLASIALAVVFINQPDYKVLFTNLSAEDAGQITSRLQEKKIPYQLSPGGDTISVPGEQVSQLRLELAASGLRRLRDLRHEEPGRHRVRTAAQPAARPPG